MPSGSAEPGGAGRRQGGFTLLEALVALLLVGLGVVGALEAASRTLRTQADVGRHAEAAALADERLSALALLSRDSLELCCDTPWRPVRLDDRGYRRRADVTEAEGEGLWLATVEVAWEDGSVRLETLLYRPDRPAGARGSP